MKLPRDISGRNAVKKHYRLWATFKSGYAPLLDPETEEIVALVRVDIPVRYTEALERVNQTFYLLGASVLHAKGEIPQGFQMIETLSAMYTESLGSGARTIFLAGAFAVLFSTLFSVLAGRTRIYSDIFGQLGWINFHDQQQRRRSIAYVAWAVPFIWAVIFGWAFYDEHLTWHTLVGTTLIIAGCLIAGRPTRGESGS